MEMVTERIIRNPARRYTMNLTRLERELLYAALYRYVQARTGDVRHDEEDRQALVDMFHYIVDQLRGQKEPPLDINNKFRLGPPMGAQSERNASRQIAQTQIYAGSP